MPCVLPRYVSEVTVEAHAHVRRNNAGRIMPTRARLRSGEVNPVLHPTFHVRSNEMHAQLPLFQGAHRSLLPVADATCIRLPR